MISKFLDDFYEILFKPAQGMKKISQEKNIWQGLLIYLIISVIVSLSTSTYQLRSLLTQDFSGIPMPIELTESMLRFMPFIDLLFKVTFGALLFLVWTAILHLSADVLGGENRGYRLGAVLGYAQLPYIIMAPVSLLARYVPFDLISVASIILFFWTLILRIIGLRETYNFSTPWSILCYFLPAAALILIVIIFLIITGAFFLPLVSEFVPLQ